MCTGQDMTNNMNCLVNNVLQIPSTNTQKSSAQMQATCAVNLHNQLEIIFTHMFFLLDTIIFSMLFKLILPVMGVAMLSSAQSFWHMLDASLTIMQLR